MEYYYARSTMERTIHTDVPIAARVHAPRGPSRGVAFIAHRECVLTAYAWLGGTQDDPVVQQLVSALRAFHVVTFNSRGAPPSGGRVSWTQAPECRDYQAVVDSVLGELDGAIERPAVVFCVRRCLQGYSCGALQ